MKFSALLNTALIALLVTNSAVEISAQGLTFDSLDTDGNGLISADEIRNSAVEISTQGLTFDSLDTDQTYLKNAVKAYVGIASIGLLGPLFPPVAVGYGAQQLYKYYWPFLENSVEISVNSFANAYGAAWGTTLGFVHSNLAVKAASVAICGAAGTALGPVGVAACPVILGLPFAAAQTIYPFTPESINENAGRHQGVYEVGTVRNGVFNPWYTGMSQSNMHTRLSSHVHGRGNQGLADYMSSGSNNHLHFRTRYSSDPVRTEANLIASQDMVNNGLNRVSGWSPDR